MEGGKPERTGTRRGRNEGEQLGIGGPEEYTWWQCQAIGLGWCDCVLGILVVGHQLRMGQLCAGDHAWLLVLGKLIIGRYVSPTASLLKIVSLGIKLSYFVFFWECAGWAVGGTFNFLIGKMTIVQTTPVCSLRPFLFLTSQNRQLYAS